LRLVLLAGVTLSSLVFGSMGAGAQPIEVPMVEDGARRVARVYGVLESVESESLTLLTPAGRVSLLLGANTIFRVPGVKDPGVDDLVSGDRVGAFGWWDGSQDAFHAFGVARLAEERVFPLGGKLAEIDRDTLLIETLRGSAAAHADEETVYRVPGMEAPGLEDLSVGMQVALRGTLNPDGSLQARVVAAKAGPRRVRGEILAVDEHSFALRTRGGRKLALLVAEATEFRAPGVEDASIADLQVGDKVAAEGEIGQDGVLEATLVVALPERMARLRGQVTAFEGTTLMLETLGGQVAVHTDTSTLFRIPGIEAPSLDEVELGDKVVAAGAWEDEATFHAVGVGVRGRREALRGAVRGRVIRVGVDSLLVGSVRGPVTVLVDDETQFHVPGVQDPGLGDFETGVLVGARGVWDEDGVLLAAHLGRR